MLAGAQDAAAALLPAERSTGRTSWPSSAPRRSSTCTWSTTARCCAARSSPRSARPVQWVFDRTAHSGLADSRPGAQYLALSQSAVQDEIELPVAELRARYLPELERLLPAARGAEVLDFFVTRERTATFDPAPGTAALRPQAGTRSPACCWPVRGRPPAGPRRWRAPCAAGTPPPTPRSRETGPASRWTAATGGGHDDARRPYRNQQNRSGRGNVRGGTPQHGRGTDRNGGPAAVPELLARGRTLCTPPLRAAVARLAPPMDAVAAYHFGWTDRDGKPTAATAARRCAPRSRCSRRRPRAPPRRWESPAVSPLNWCTTSPCCMMI